MAVKIPLVIGGNGLPQQLQSTDSIVVPTTTTDIRTATNANAGAIVIGATVYASAAGSIDKARANAAGTSVVVGLVYDVSIAAAGVGNYAVAGFMNATTTQWDAVAGTTGGLAAGTRYFLDPATAGKMTSVPPTTVGQTIVLIGIGLSTTDLELNPQFIAAL